METAPLLEAIGQSLFDPASLQFKLELVNSGLNLEFIQTPAPSTSLHPMEDPDFEIDGMEIINQFKQQHLDTAQHPPPQSEAPFSSITPGLLSDHSQPFSEEGLMGNNPEVSRQDEDEEESDSDDDMNSKRGDEDDTMEEADMSKKLGESDNLEDVNMNLANKDDGDVIMDSEGKENDEGEEEDLDNQRGLGKRGERSDVGAEEGGDERDEPMELDKNDDREAR
jgi:hypothetical protein